MSKENGAANLRLLGSPVNLTYRSKRKDDKKNIRNRPRSALQNKCFTPDIQERNRRPFSADTKPRATLSNNYFLRSFSCDSNDQNFGLRTVKIIPPTTEILKDINRNSSFRRFERECSNASDFGSEDTFISLGTKIKARAQSVPKNKNSYNKNHLKYRALAKKNKRAMDEKSHDTVTQNNYDLEVTITDKVLNSDENELKEYHCTSNYGLRQYESYFLSVDNHNSDKQNNEKLIGRVSFGTNRYVSETNKVTDPYTSHLMLNKQLSLVEEESTQDLESFPSQNYSSLSPLEKAEQKENIEDLCGEESDSESRNAYVTETNKTFYNDLQKMNDSRIAASNKYKTDSLYDPRTYSSFYDDFTSNEIKDSKESMSSTVATEHRNENDISFNLLAVENLEGREKMLNDNQSKSLDFIAPSTSIEKKQGMMSRLENKFCKWNDTRNHSRLLYKDFFLKKENFVPPPPQNSPKRSDSTLPSKDSNIDIQKDVNKQTDFEYPSYLVNSTTKAYTSKIIEDYKKEIEAINNLHELTIKDLKTDVVSPTPFHIDKMFELNAKEVNDLNNETKIDSCESIIHFDNQQNTQKNDCHFTTSNTHLADVSKVSTKELIQNYFKVKDGEQRSGPLPRNINKERKFSTGSSNGEESSNTNKQQWNNKNNNLSIRNKYNKTNSFPGHIKNQTQKTVFTAKAPLSARIDSVEIDKDIDSWMSLAMPSPTEPDEKSVKSGRESKEIIDYKNEVQTDKLESTAGPTTNDVSISKTDTEQSNKLNSKSTVLDIYSMLKEIESYGDNPVKLEKEPSENDIKELKDDSKSSPKDNFMEIFEFLEKVEKSANEALSVVTDTLPQSIPQLDTLLRLPQTELAQRLVTASLQLEERSCCIALLQESLTNHKEQMITKVSALEKQSQRNMSKVKQECEEAIKRHQNFIDQLINDKKTLNHRIEQLVDERRSLEERWKRSAQALEDRYKLELKNQHDKMAAAQQVARQRWVRQKAEKIKELTVKGLEGELREMADQQQKELADLKMRHAEQLGRIQVKHSTELEEQRRSMEEEKEMALVKERQLGSARLEKQILELELSYQEQRTRLISEMRAENERVASGLNERDKNSRMEIDKLREEQEKILENKRAQLNKEIASERAALEEQLRRQREILDEEFQQYKREFEAEQQTLLKKKINELSTQLKQERDKEIEKAIESMEAEAQAGRKELQEALRRNKEQYETELKELAETEQATLKRYQEAQARVRNTENKCAEFEVTISQLEAKNRILTEKNLHLELRVDEIRKDTEEKWRSRLDSYEKQLEEGQRVHEEQMHQLYAKVKIAVARKDSAIQALTRECSKAQEKLTLLEQKLQQQRKDFLKHK